jgi:hypothetical protein
VSALDNLLNEVRLEAELEVRTEYENTVVEQRARITELETALAVANNDREAWRSQANKYEDRIIKGQAALEKLAATL